MLAKLEKVIIDVPLVVYPFDLIFLFGLTDAEAKKFLGDRWLASLKMIGRGKFIFNKKYNLGIIRCAVPTNPADAGILAHEILHAVYQILSYCGMPLTPSSEEAYTYLMSYVTEQVYSKLQLKITIG